MVDSSAPRPTVAKASSPRPLLDVGDRFARFTVLHLVGRGGMGEVYAAYDRALRRRVALKILRGTADAAWDEALEEARLTAHLTHPNVVAVYDVGRTEDRAFFAMELVEGDTLDVWLRAEPRTIAEVIEVFRQAGAGLHAAHEAGVIHRDFKPSNVLVGRDGRVRVADFGLARLAERQADTGPAGTIGFAPPEQLAGTPPHPSADQFAFCVAMRAALASTTRRSDRDREAAALLRRARGVIERGLQRDPRRRYPTMEALLRALAPHRSRLLPMVAAAASVGFAVLALGGRAPDTCPSVDALRERYWSQDVTAHVAARFAATGVPHRETAWARSRVVLDDRVDTWAQAVHGACTSATAVSGCTARAEAEIIATVGVLERADADVVDNAAALVDSIVDIPACERIDDSSVAATDARRDAVVARLSAARAERAAGRARAARDALEALIPEAHELDEPALFAEVELALAESVVGFDDEGRAVELLRDAAFLASRAGADGIALHAATRLVLLEANHPALDGPDEGWEPFAMATLARLGMPTRERVRLEFARAARDSEQGRHAEAAVILRRTIVELGDLDGPDSLAVASAERNLAVVLLYAGELDESRSVCEHALRVRETQLGPEHPEVADLLLLLQGIDDAIGHHETAIADTLRAAAIYRANYGPDHAETLLARHQHAIATQQVETARGCELLEGVFADYVRLRGESHQETAGARFDLARCWYELGDHERALPEAQRAARDTELRFGPDHAMTLAIRILVGNIMRKQRRLADAREMLVDVDRRSAALPSPRRAAARDALAQLDSDDGRHEQAAAGFEAAAALWAEAYGAQHEQARLSREAAARELVLAARG